MTILNKTLRANNLNYSVLLLQGNKLGIQINPDSGQLDSLCILISFFMSGQDSPRLNLYYLGLWLALFLSKTLLVEKTVIVELDESWHWGPSELLVRVCFTLLLTQNSETKAGPRQARVVHHRVYCSNTESNSRGSWIKKPLRQVLKSYCLWDENQLAQKYVDHAGMSHPRH